jgi:hypothetical protein
MHLPPCRSALPEAKGKRRTGKLKEGENERGANREIVI